MPAAGNTAHLPLPADEGHAVAGRYGAPGA